MSEINVLIPHNARVDFLIKDIKSAGLNTKGLFDSPTVKIGTNFRIIDFDDDCLIEVLNDYIDWKMKEFQKFSHDDKFNYIVIDASSVDDYGINNFPTQERIKELLKEDGKIIIQKCTVCAGCNNDVKRKYPDLNLKFMFNSHRHEISNYILGEILEIQDD